jgi:hypothetical protein
MHEIALSRRPRNQVSQRVVAQSLDRRARRAAMLLLMMIAVVVLAPIIAAAQTVAQAAGVTPTITTWQDALIYALPLLVPILIALAKKWLYTTKVNLDGSTSYVAPVWLPKWSLPILAPLIGMAIVWLSSIGSTTPNLLIAAAAGALGVFVREVTKPLTNIG